MIATVQSQCLPIIPLPSNICRDNKHYGKHQYSIPPKHQSNSVCPQTGNSSTVGARGQTAQTVFASKTAPSGAFFGSCLFQQPTARKKYIYIYIYIICVCFERKESKNSISYLLIIWQKLSSQHLGCIKIGKV